MIYKCLAHTHTHTLAHTRTSSPPSLPRPHAPIGPPRPFSAQLIAPPRAGSAAAAPPANGAKLPAPAPSPPAVWPQHPASPPRSAPTGTRHPHAAEHSSLPASRLFITLEGARHGFGCSGCKTSLWGPGWGICPRQSLAGPSRTPCRARGAQLPGWGSAGGWEGCVPAAGCHRGCQPTCWVRSRLGPPRGDNHSGGDRLAWESGFRWPWGCPRISGEGEFLPVRGARVPTCRAAHTAAEPGKGSRCHPGRCGVAGDAVNPGGGAAGGSTVCSTEPRCPVSGGGFSLPRETPEGLVCCGCAFIVTGLRGWVWPSPRAEPCQTHRSHGNWQPAGRAPRCFPAAELSPGYLLGSSPGDAACRLLQPLARAPSSAGDALNKNFKIKPFPEHPGAWRPGCPPPHWEPRCGAHAAAGYGMERSDASGCLPPPLQGLGPDMCWRGSGGHRCSGTPGSATSRAHCPLPPGPGNAGVTPWPQPASPSSTSWK